MEAATVMKKITAGDFIGQFLVEEVLRPFKNGNALIKVRYQGSYVRGYLCVVDSRQYGSSEINGDKLLGDIREYNNVFKGKSKGSITPDHSQNRVLLPDLIFSTLSPDGIRLMLGYFRTNNWSRAIISNQLSLNDLASIAEVLDIWHKKGVGHGMLHPCGVWKDDEKSQPNFICPIFPVILLDEEYPWVYDFGEKSVEKDRKAFCQMAADFLNGESDGRGFLGRLELFETSVATKPLFKSFLSSKDVSCEQLLRSVSATKEADDRLKKARIARKGRQKWFSKLTMAAAVCLILAGCYVFLQEKWDKEDHQKAIQSAIKEIYEAKDAKQWQNCIDKAQVILQKQPNNRDVLSIKNEADVQLKVATLISDASMAKKNLNWTECYNKANEVLEKQVNNIDAQSLKEEADSKLKAISKAVEAARQARRDKDWQKCITDSKDALTSDPFNAEAAELKNNAEKMIKMDGVIKKAQEAKKNKKWEECLQMANEALAIVNDDTEALNLRDTASQKINKSIDALAFAREASGQKNWKVCIEKANEALSVGPSEEAEYLKASAEKKWSGQINLSAALESKNKRDWETCLLKAAEALSIDPENQEAARLKLEAELVKGRLDSLVSARAAQKSQKWKLCLEMATIALGNKEEPEHSEALVLKSDAERNLKLQEVLVAAREAKVAEKWTECESRADKVLADDPNHAEAKELKSFAKRMQQSVIANLLTLAHEAREKKDWETCLGKASEVSFLDPKNKDAEKLREESSRQISIANLLKEGQKLAALEAWQLCSDKYAEVLVLDPNNQEVSALRDKALQKLNPYITLKFSYNNSIYNGKIWDGQTVFDAAKPLELRKGQGYRFLWWVKLPSSSDGKINYALDDSELIIADWLGNREYVIPISYRNIVTDRQFNWAFDKKGISRELR